MIHIQIPANVTIEGVDEHGRPHSRSLAFVGDFLEHVLTNDQSFGESASAVLAAADILAAFRKHRPLDIVAVTSDMHARMKRVLDKPNPPFRPLILKQAPAFLRAILEPLTDKQLAAISPKERPTEADIAVTVNGAPAPSSSQVA